MADKTTIFNMALVFMRDRRVLAPDDADEAARTLLLLFDSAVDAAIRAHPWNCARARILLGNPEAAPPAFGYARAFTLPSSNPFCLRALTINATEHNPSGDRFNVEGRELLTDAGSPVNLEFLKRVTNTGEFDAQFTVALAVLLAAWAGPKLGAGDDVVKGLEKRFARELPAARSTDAQEGWPPAFFEDSFIGARR